MSFFATSSRTSPKTPLQVPRDSQVTREEREVRVFPSPFAPIETLLSSLGLTREVRSSHPLGVRGLADSQGCTIALKTAPTPLQPLHKTPGAGANPPKTQKKYRKNDKVVELTTRRSDALELSRFGAALLMPLDPTEVRGRELRFSSAPLQVRVGGSQLNGSPRLGEVEPPLDLFDGRIQFTELCAKETWADIFLAT